MYSEPQGFDHICVMRFSYLSLGGFKLSKLGLGEAKRKLFDPERLNRRFHLFERLTFPSLMSQTNKKFKLIVITSDELPRTYFDRLSHMLQQMENARLLCLPPIPREVASSIDAHRCKERPYLATTRLDDDDAISRDFMEVTQKKCTALIEHKIIPMPVAIAFNNGFFLHKALSGNKVNGIRQKTPLGIGLTLLTKNGDRQTVYTRNHRQVAAFWNVISDVDQPAFIRSVHEDNDSNAFSDGVEVPYQERDLKEVIWNRFGISYGDLLAI